MEAYREAIKERVCKICADRNEDGSCNLPEGRFCSIDRHLPLIIEAIKSVQSDRVEDYSRSIGETVCKECSEDEKGHCHFRELDECLLENFAYLVVEAIEEVDERRATR